VVAVGRNYKEHVEEAARSRRQEIPLPEHPVFFTKRASAVIGPEAPIPWDAKLTEGLDWEAELAVVFGRRGTNIPPAQVFDYVFGYTCANDISARDLQSKRHGGQWFKGKSLDGSCPLGPWIVTADELLNPHDLEIVCRVNGQVKQRSNTRMMIFDIPAMAAELSAGLTLEPGDVFLTGTPSGVGFARTPPEFLRPGDVVEVEIQGIGVLRNRVVAVEARG
jgi:2-keto-4-pentenoate hydratase/2-oxohepta-3-ene-1,7-dioic acid hydratase in catechol pathway